MGKTIVHAGGAGNGQAAKICNNMILGISMIAVSEAFVLAEKLGLDKQKLFDIASKSSGRAGRWSNYCPVPGPVPTSPANRDYQAGFTAAMMLKDLALAQDAAKAAGAATPMGAEAAALYVSMWGRGRRVKIFPESSTSSAAARKGCRSAADPFPNCPLRLTPAALDRLPRELPCFALRETEFRANARANCTGERAVTNSRCIRRSIVRSPSQINSMFILQFKLILDHAP